MDRRRKIFLAYQGIAKRKSHLEAVLDVCKIFNLSLFAVLELVREQKKICK